MMTMKAYGYCILFLFIFLLLPVLTVAKENDALDGNVISVNDTVITGEKSDDGVIYPLTSEPFTLQGIEDHAEFYYDVPISKLDEGSVLNLNVQYSNLLKEGSSITVAIDENPLYSAELDLDKQEMDIQIPLDHTSVDQGFHTITISFYGYLTEELCVNEDNPANWLTILPKSNVFLNIGETVDRDDVLQDYPYPFIQNLQDQPIQSKIIIPDTPSTNILTAALQVANDLNKNAANEESIQIVKESNVDSISEHIIAIGTEEQWTGIVKNLYDSAHLKLSKDDIVISNFYIQSSELQKQIMFVTAKDDAIIADKITALTVEHLRDQLTGNEVSIGQLPMVPENEIKQKHTFQEIGIPNQTLTSMQSISPSYFYTLPPYMNLNEQATLHMRLKIAETLFHSSDKMDVEEDTELVILINGIPHSTAIKNLKEQNNESVYTVDIPIAPHVLQMERYLTIQFHVHGVESKEICALPSDDKWIFIDEDSYLQIGIQNNEGSANFKTWPAPFLTTNGLENTIILLNEHDESIIRHLLLLTNTFGDYTQLNDLELVYEKDVDEEYLKSHHVIVLGNPLTFSIFENDIDNLRIKPNETKDLNVSPFQFLNETSKNIAWMQQSVWNEDRMMVVFSPRKSDDHEPFISENLVNFLQTNNQRSDIIVESTSGEIFTHNTGNENITSNDLTESSSDERLNNINNILIVGFIAVLLLGIIIFLYFVKKRKRNSE